MVACDIVSHHWYMCVHFSCTKNIFCHANLSHRQISGIFKKNLGIVKDSAIIVIIPTPLSLFFGFLANYLFVDEKFVGDNYLWQCDVHVATHNIYVEVCALLVQGN